MKILLPSIMAAFLLAGRLAMAQQTAPPAGRGTGGFGNAGFVPNPVYDKEPPQLPADMKPAGVLISSKKSRYRDLDRLCEEPTFRR